MLHLYHLGVCPNEDLPEVELVSMLEEQLPQYKLQVDSLYLSENEDWIQCPGHHSQVPEVSSSVLAEETFRYMSKYPWSQWKVPYYHNDGSKWIYIKLPEYVTG